ncbi:MAG: GspE/PulE family protein [Victivallales bacterium]|jgi:type II secretory ATPase GspE/PulE/Tfp pilus assembly ATPase PilB-like protein|nr:GspE/PulE family protein [Victivallales bacterium]
MSENVFDFPAARERLRKLLSHKNPDYPANPSREEARAADRDMVQTGLLTEAQLAEIYTEAYNCEVVDEEEFKIPEPFPDAPYDFFNANGCLPEEWDDETIGFLVIDPYDLEQLMFMVRRTWNAQMRFRFVRRTFLERMSSKLQSIEAENDALELEDENILRSMAGEAKIVRLVNDIFTRAVELGASDIHIEPGEDNVSVRCRVDGVLTEIINTPLSQFPAIASRIKLLGGLNIAESRLPQDGRTNIQLGRQELDMRISTIPILTGESIVLRLLNQEAISFDLGILGMSETHLAQFKKIIQIPHGIILVVGPTGSGKTTTLYSVINQLNDNKKKIITIEDPVEYKTAGLCQMQVNSKIGVTFAAGLRSIVRQDPDIILVGEIRDRETADIAINAALTGHLVLSTLHTNDAVGAVTRLLDMGVENFLVSSALFGVLSQRLVRKICPDCHGKTTDGGGNKCRKCNGSGYKGRCGIFELLTVSDQLRSAINRSASSSELEAIAVKEGMVTLQEDGLSKVKAGVTTAEELNRSTAEL